MKIAIQLYTLRVECQIDFLKTLEQVAALGYEGVEFAGFHHIEASVLKVKLEELKLVPLSAHIPLEELENNLEEVINYNKTIGNFRIVCPFSKWENEEEFQKIVKILTIATAVLKENDMELFYHNHSHEFEKINNRYKLDLLIDAVEGMKMELDTCWVSQAKVDVLEYMESHKEYLALIHIKDSDYNGDDFILKALGEGCLPILDIINKSEQLELEWIIVENDFPKPDGITNITRSMEFLRRAL